MQQLQMARDEYDEEATLFVFRLKSLKRGQSRSLLTQAARHHAAQVLFFLHHLYYQTFICTSSWLMRVLHYFLLKPAVLLQEGTQVT